jgi:chemotaxis signal transduction protein
MANDTRMPDKSELQRASMHCVFRRGGSYFALPAASVREVAPRPPIASVPHSGPALIGLCHVRSEFLPVLSLQTLVADCAAALPSEQQMLVVNGADGPWGLLVDQVVALDSVEASMPMETGTDDPFGGAIVGWGAYADQVVRVIHPQRFHQMAEQAIREHSVDAGGRSELAAAAAGRCAAPGEVGCDLARAAGPQPRPVL